MKEEIASPFRFGILAKEIAFVNREQEIIRLIASIKSGISITLISPRRWGKSSLIHKVGTKIAIENQQYRVVFLDLFSVATKEEFYTNFAIEVIKATENNFEAWARIAKDFLSKISPKLTYSPNDKESFGISFDWENKAIEDEILKLPEKIAQEKNIKILICIDEFQNIVEFDNQIAFQKKLRSVWQKFENTSFCLYGSKRNLMVSFFDKQSMPFYRFGEIMFLEKISENHWIKYITESFERTGKKVTEHIAQKIAQLMENHPYYVQQLSHNLWIYSGKEVGIENLHHAFKTMLEHNAIMYKRIIEELSPQQINLLKALIRKEPQLTAKKTIATYNLGTSASVLKAKKALEHKQVIDTFSGEIIFEDPAFAHWFKYFYLNDKMIIS